MSQHAESPSYYRYGEHVVCLLPDEESPVGRRLMVPRFGKNLPAAARRAFPKLPKEWRKLIQQAIRDREGDQN